MEFLQCKACGSFAMVLMEVEVDEESHEEAELLNLDEQESRFYSCQVCGDNWLSIRQDEDGDCSITFIHQMGIQPRLKRVAHMSTGIVVNENTVHEWQYFMGEEEVGEADWRDQLDARRLVLKAICSN